MEDYGEVYSIREWDNLVTDKRMWVHGRINIYSSIFTITVARKDNNSTEKLEQLN